MRWPPPWVVGGRGRAAPLPCLLAIWAGASLLHPVVGRLVGLLQVRLLLLLLLLLPLLIYLRLVPLRCRPPMPSRAAEVPGERT